MPRSRCKIAIVGIGGSATNDGGAGMVQALGGKLLDSDGNEIGFGGGKLGKLYRIDLTNFDTRLKDVVVEVACDVKNPVSGEKRGIKSIWTTKGSFTESSRNIRY